MSATSLHPQFDPDPANSTSPHRHEPGYWFHMAECWDDCARFEAARGNHADARQYRREAAMWRDYAFKLARERDRSRWQRSLAQRVRA